jgi:hypothetical protein
VAWRWQGVSELSAWPKRRIENESILFFSWFLWLLFQPMKTGSDLLLKISSSSPANAKPRVGGCLSVSYKIQINNY